MAAIEVKEQFQNYVILCLHNFLFGNIVTVKSIFGIKGGLIQ